MKASEKDNEMKTIEGWSKQLGIIVHDPDGFDRSNINLMNELFTKKEFLKGLTFSTISVLNSSKIIKG